MKQSGRVDARGDLQVLPQRRGNRCCDRKHRLHHAPLGVRGYQYDGFQAGLL